MKKVVLFVLVMSLCACGQKAKPKDSKIKGCNEWTLVSGLDGIYRCDTATNKWVLDIEATQQSREIEAQYEKEKNELRWALVSRVLTDKEMERVSDLGISLFTHNGETYYEADKVKEMNEALLQQFRLRTASKCKDGKLKAGRPSSNEETPTP